MNPVLETVLSVGLVALLVAALHVPLGTWMYRVFTDTHHWRVERAAYRAVGVDPDTEQRWSAYALSVLAFAVASVVILFALLVAQPWLPLSQGRSMDWHTAFNTAVSFVTNTNWQSYAGETGAGTPSRCRASRCRTSSPRPSGIAVAVALIRGLARATGSDRLGNFWVDLARGIVRILLPLAAVARGRAHRRRRRPEPRRPTDVTTLTGGTRVLPAGPSPRRRPSRSSAPTAAASSTPTPRTRSRTPTRSRTSSRSS